MVSFQQDTVLLLEYVLFNYKSYVLDNFIEVLDNMILCQNILTAFHVDM